MKKTKRGKSKPSKSIELVDPRQISFIAAYTDPKSKTYTNALQSALAAGYAQEYAESITSKMPVWLSESIGKDKRIKQAEKHIDEVLEMPIITQAMGAFGPLFEKKESIVKVKLKNGRTRDKKIIKKVPIMTYNTSRIKEKSKVVEFTLESLDRATYGKERGGGGGLVFNIAVIKERYSA